MIPRLFALTGLCLAAVGCAEQETVAPVPAAPPVTIVIHGGAGALSPGRYTPEQEAEYKEKLTEALNAGYAVLEEGGAALDAVETAIVIMEDSPLFNAGKGAVFTSEGKNELDASLMDGASLNVGAAAGVTRVKNPIRLAREIMDNSRHVMFARDGAETFAEAHGLEMVDPDYFYTEGRWNDYQRALASANEKKEGALPADFKFGTVGAVALDANGNLAAGTSTGGITFKQYGRVGDSPVIGAGTYADNKSCAVSSTGQGEFFIRLTVARDICAQVEYAGKTVAEAADDVINHRLQAMGAEGGVIVLGKDGAYAMTFNTAGMFRGFRQGNAVEVAIYGD